MGLSGSKAVTELSGRIVDALTGEILGSVTGYGERAEPRSRSIHTAASHLLQRVPEQHRGQVGSAGGRSFYSAAAGKINEVAANLAAEAQRPGSPAWWQPSSTRAWLSTSGRVRGEVTSGWKYRLTFIPGLMDPVRACGHDGSSA